MKSTVCKRFSPPPRLSGKILIPALIVLSAVAVGASIAVVHGEFKKQSGSEQPIQQAPTAAPAAQRQSAPVKQLVEPLATRLAADPNDPSGWTLLAKSYDYLGKPELAADAYRQAIRHGNDDPAVAEALTAAENEFLKAALTGGALGAPQAASDSTAASAIRGRVTVSDELLNQIQPGHAVFVYAKEIGGASMPLAVLRATGANLPLDFVLDDSTAMMPGRTISAATRVAVIARVSASGNATTQPGDLIGESAPLDPRDGTPVALSIDRVVPDGP